MTTITVYLNETSRFGPYSPADTLAAVFTYESEDADLENAYRLLNVGDDPAFGTPDPAAVKYRLAGNRSLSVGDVIQLGTGSLSTFHAVGRFGFATIDPPTNLN